MANGIHHINFVVRDLRAAVPAWERILDRRVDSFGRLEKRGADLAHFDLGVTRIVLVQPTGPGIPADFLAANGEGFFLMSLSVESLDDEIRRLGRELLQGEVRSGVDDWLVQDLALSQTFGAQLQLVQD